MPDGDASKIQQNSLDGSTAVMTEKDSLNIWNIVKDLIKSILCIV